MFNPSTKEIHELLSEFKQFNRGNTNPHIFARPKLIHWLATQNEVPTRATGIIQYGIKHSLIRRIERGIYTFT